MYFLSENMFFLRIVQIIDINPKNFDALGYSFRPSQNSEKSKLTSDFTSPDGLTKKNTKRHPLFSATKPAKTKSTCRVPAQKQKPAATRKLNIPWIQKGRIEFCIISLIFLLIFVSVSNIFPKNHLSPRRSIFSRHLPSFFSFALCKTQTTKKTKKIRLISLIRLIKQYLNFYNIHSLSFIVVPFFASLSVAAFPLTRINTTQLLSKDTFYFLRAVIYYSIE